MNKPDSGFIQHCCQLNINHLWFRKPASPVSGTIHKPGNHRTEKTINHEQ